MHMSAKLWKVLHISFALIYRHYGYNILIHADVSYNSFLYLQIPDKKKFLIDVLLPELWLQLACKYTGCTYEEAEGVIRPDADLSTPFTDGLGSNAGLRGDVNLLNDALNSAPVDDDSVLIHYSRDPEVYIFRVLPRLYTLNNYFSKTYNLLLYNLTLI